MFIEQINNDYRPFFFFHLDSEKTELKKKFSKDD